MSNYNDSEEFETYLKNLNALSEGEDSRPNFNPKDIRSNSSIDPLILLGLTMAMFDFSDMRTHRLPEDTEGMTDENQIPSRMDKSLQDLINGVTAQNPRGLRQIISIRFPNEMIDKLTAHGQTLPETRGFKTLVQDILQEYIDNNNL